MSEAVEEYINKRAKEAAKIEKENLALRMLKAGKYELEEIASLIELPIEQVKILKSNL
jgi:hypothetical protein